MSKIKHFKYVDRPSLAELYIDLERGETCYATRTEDEVINGILDYNNNEFKTLAIFYPKGERPNCLPHPVNKK